MKDESPPPDGKSPHERFVALGKKIMSVSRAEIETREKKWRQKRRRKMR